MRTLITHGYFLHQDAKEREIMKPYPPLGILYLSAHLRRHGVEPEIYDSTFGSREDLNRILHDGAPGITRRLRNAHEAPQRARYSSDGARRRLENSQRPGSAGRAHVQLGPFPARASTCWSTLNAPYHRYSFVTMTGYDEVFPEANVEWPQSA